MKSAKLLAAIVCVAFLFTLTGCADNSPDGLVRQQVAQMNRLSDAFEAKKSKETIDSIQKEMKATADKLEALGLSVEEKAKLVEKHKDIIQEASVRMMKYSMEMMKHEAKDGLMDAINSM